MQFNAIYFSYIRVPNSKWFTRALLYWDRVAAIVPAEFTEDPDRLGRHMVDLIREELVEQIVPGTILWQAANFSDAFLRYVDAKYQPVHHSYISDWQLRNTNASDWPLVHMEKLYNLGDGLHQRQLAYRETGKYSSWFRVEPRVADDFMAYLAGVLGQMPENSRYSPITNLRKNLRPFVPTRKQSDATSVRRLILKQILPAPSNQVSAADLFDFKARHKEALVRLRRQVEDKTSELVAIKDDQSRAERLAFLTADFRETIDELERRMRERKGWQQIDFGTLCIVTGAGLSGWKSGVVEQDWMYGVPCAALSLAPVIYSAFSNPSLAIKTEPLGVCGISRTGIGEQVIIAS
jgi:hypothetical protein